MAMIRCKACGARYSYEKEGCCPGCGAYNRPPKRERVNPDGTVQHMTDAEYARRSKATGKVCFEEKECYEEKVCYEDQARRGGRKSTSRTDRTEKAHSHAAVRENPAAEVLRQVTARTGSRRKSKGRSVLGILIAIIIALGASTGVLEAVFDRVEQNLPWHEEPVGPAPSQDPADEYFYDAVMGEELLLEDGSTITVQNWTLDERSKTITLEMDVVFADSNHELYATLLCTDADGDEIVLSEFHTAWSDPDTLRLQFKTLDYKDLAPFALVLDEYEEDLSVGTLFIDLR